MLGCRSTDNDRTTPNHSVIIHIFTVSMTSQVDVENTKTRTGQSQGLVIRIRIDSRGRPAHNHVGVVGNSAVLCNKEGKTSTVKPYLLWPAPQHIVISLV